MQSRVTYERTEKLRLGLKMMGLQAAPYWMSVVLMESASSLVSVIIVIIIGAAFQFRFFTMVNPVGMYFTRTHTRTSAHIGCLFVLLESASSLYL